MSSRRRTGYGSSRHAATNGDPLAVGEQDDDDPVTLLNRLSTQLEEVQQPKEEVFEEQEEDTLDHTATHPYGAVHEEDLRLVKQQLEFSKERLKQLEWRLTATEKERDEAKAESQRATQAYRRSQHKLKELDHAANEQIQQTQQHYEQEYRELQSAFDAERTQFLREKLDLQRMYEEEILALRKAAEEWAQEVEREYQQRVLAIEQENRDTIEAYRTLETELKLSQIERERTVKKYKEKMKEMELTLGEAKADYSEKLRRDRETRSILSRRRVSQALDELQL